MMHRLWYFFDDWSVPTWSPVGVDVGSLPWIQFGLHALPMFHRFIFAALFSRTIEPIRVHYAAANSRPNVVSKWKYMYAYMMYDVTRQQLPRINPSSRGPGRCTLVVKGRDQVYAVPIHEWRCVLGSGSSSAYTGWPKNCKFSCLTWNWCSFVKSQPNFIIFGRLIPE